MGKAHSHAWRNVARLLPRRCRPSRQQVLVGRDGGAVRRPPRAVRLGRGRPPTGGGPRPRRHRHPRRLHPRPPARRDRHRRARGRQARAGREAAGQLRGRGGEDGRRRGGRRATRRALDGRLQLPARAGPGAGPRTDRRRAYRRRPPGPHRLPPGLARRRRGSDDVAAAPRDRRIRGAGRPRLARRRPARASCSASEVTGVNAAT